MDKLSRRVRCCSDDEIKYDNENPYECHTCTQVGVPVFHSTSCHPDQQPEWEALAGSSLVPINNRTNRRNTRKVLTDSRSTGNRQTSGISGRILDPRSARLQRWNRVILLARGMALAVDPLFFFSMSISRCGDKQLPCVYMDGGIATIMAVIRTCVDLVQTWHLCIQFRVAYVSKESLVVGYGRLVWDARAVASHHLRSLAGFWLDAFVILPIPQVVYFQVVPRLLKENKIMSTISMLQFVFLLQFLPKVYHCFCLMRRMRKVTGYIFGTIWWGLGLNLIAYFLASHASGGYWYILAVQRVASCLTQQCERSKNCNQSLSCAWGICYPGAKDTCDYNNSMKTPKPFCLDDGGGFPYGLYVNALPLFYSNSVTTKVLYCNLWGLMALSTVGNNLEPTSSCSEVIFAMLMVLAGLLLFTLLIGNIQVFLHAIMVRKRKMQLRYGDMEWWMKHRQLPSHLKHKVREHEHQSWEMMGGQDEMELIKDLPEGLRRDIKRYFCLNLIKRAPLLHNLDSLILDNICDRAKPVVFFRDEKIIREGDPVQKLAFIVRGRIRRSQRLTKGRVAISMLEPGSFLGDELLSWSLRRPFLDRLPASFATFTCVESVEAYALDADDFRYITDRFRCHFANRSIKQMARYYSSNWRTWAAVKIQFAWRHFKNRTRNCRGNVTENRGNESEHRPRQCAAMLMSFSSHHHIR